MVWFRRCSVLLLAVLALLCIVNVALGQSKPRVAVVVVSPERNAAITSRAKTAAAKQDVELLTDAEVEAAKEAVTGSKASDVSQEDAKKLQGRLRADRLIVVRVARLKKKGMYEVSIEASGPGETRQQGSRQCELDEVAGEVERFVAQLPALSSVASPAGTGQSAPAQSATSVPVPVPTPPTSATAPVPVPTVAPAPSASAAPPGPAPAQQGTYLRKPPQEIPAPPEGWDGGVKVGWRGSDYFGVGLFGVTYIAGIALGGGVAAVPVYGPFKAADEKGMGTAKGAVLWFDGAFQTGAVVGFILGYVGSIRAGHPGRATESGSRYAIPTASIPDDVSILSGVLAGFYSFGVVGSLSVADSAAGFLPIAGPILVGVDQIKKADEDGKAEAKEIVPGAMLIGCGSLQPIILSFWAWRMAAWASSGSKQSTQARSTIPLMPSVSVAGNAPVIGVLGAW